MLKPVAAAYTHLAGYRQLGLKYDDILIEENPEVQKVSVRADMGDAKEGQERGARGSDLRRKGHCWTVATHARFTRGRDSLRRISGLKPNGVVG
jgi:hypothetical protein